MADTTGIKVLGIPFKLIALQDPGRRRSRIFEGIGLYTQQRAHEISDLIRRTLAKVPGTQLLTDQGKPYMAELARKTYENLELDHAPQKEGSPTAKATLERAFGILKDALNPLFEITNRLTENLPALKNPELASSLGQLMVAVYLRVYLIAARDCFHPLEKTQASQLELIAQQQRESARREESSKRLLLSQIHDAYCMEGPRERFIRAHRHHALEDIQQAERVLRERACRCQTRASRSLLRRHSSQRRRARKSQASQSAKRKAPEGSGRGPVGRRERGNFFSSILTYCSPGAWIFSPVSGMPSRDTLSPVGPDSVA
jgi:hypothetical protein